MDEATAANTNNPEAIPRDLPTSGSRLRCPVCGARFRSNTLCGRCGADLQPLMTLSLQAYQKRQQAREALRRGDWHKGALSAAEAQWMHSTPSGRHLQALAEICQASDARNS